MWKTIFHRVKKMKMKMLHSNSMLSIATKSSSGQSRWSLKSNMRSGWASNSNPVRRVKAKSSHTPRRWTRWASLVSKINYCNWPRRQAQKMLVVGRLTKQMQRRPRMIPITKLTRNRGSCSGKRWRRSSVVVITSIVSSLNRFKITSKKRLRTDPPSLSW